MRERLSFHAMIIRSRSKALGRDDSDFLGSDDRRENRFAEILRPRRMQRQGQEELPEAQTST